MQLAFFLAKFENISLHCDIKLVLHRRLHLIVLFLTNQQTNSL